MIPAGMDQGKFIEESYRRKKAGHASSLDDSRSSSNKDVFKHGDFSDETLLRVAEQVGQATRQPKRYNNSWQYLK